MPSATRGKRAFSDLGQPDDQRWACGQRTAMQNPRSFARPKAPLPDLAVLKTVAEFDLVQQFAEYASVGFAFQPEIKLKAGGD